MKLSRRELVLGAIAGVLLLGNRADAATCTGANPCNACTKCSSCKRCAKNGGTCGTCKRAMQRAHSGRGR